MSQSDKKSLGYPLINYLPNISFSLLNKQSPPPPSPLFQAPPLPPSLPYLSILGQWRRTFFQLHIFLLSLNSKCWTLHVLHLYKFRWKGGIIWNTNPPHHEVAWMKAIWKPLTQHKLTLPDLWSHLNKSPPHFSSTFELRLASFTLNMHVDAFLFIYKHGLHTHR